MNGVRANIREITIWYVTNLSRLEIVSWNSGRTTIWAIAEHRQVKRWQRSPLVSFATRCSGIDLQPSFTKNQEQDKSNAQSQNDFQKKYAVQIFQDR